MVRRPARHRPGRPAPRRTVGLNRRLGAVLLVAAALALPAACAGTTGSTSAPDSDDPAVSAPGSGVPVAVAARLDAAVAGVDRTRKALLAGPAAVVTAALALDAADEVCATGSAPQAATARRAVRSALPTARSALTATSGRASAYRTALRELTAAAAPLEAGPEQALVSAVRAGEQEAAAMEAFTAAAVRGWPAYTALDEAQSTWVDQASAGWYRTQDEAAAAYAVAVRPRRAALEDARAALRRADDGRRAATEQQRAALAAADAALEGLRGSA